MAVKLADTLAPMGEFPIANAKDIDFDDGESLQEKLDNGTLGGGGGASTADAISYVNETVGSATVDDALDTVISDYYYVKPSINSFTATPNGGIFEVGHVVSAPITFNWSYNKDITTQTLTDCTLADETVRTATYNTDITTNKTFTLTASDGKNNVSKSISYTFVSPYYVGVSSTGTLTETDIKALTKNVETKGDKTINYTTTQSYMVFAYPVSYDAISSIIDQNGFNVTDSFVRNTVTVNSVEYYVYCSNKCSGTYTIRFNYCRIVKDTIDERDALVTDGLVYENLKVYCKDTQTEYRWTGTEWEISSSSSSGTDISMTDYYTKTEVDNDFLKKTDAASTYATKTELNEKANDDEVVKKADITDLENRVTTNEADITGLQEQIDNLDIPENVDLTNMNTKMAQLETQVNDLFQSVSNGKTLVANAITGKGVSTATNATFATMATNIGKISVSSYKEETKSYNNTSSGTTRLVFTFSADVSGVKQVTPPPSNSTCYIVPETSTSMFTINGKNIILYVNGAGTWKVTAFIKA